MTVLAEQGPAGEVGAATHGVEPPSATRRGVLFWVRRYLPAEILGTAVMLGAGLAASAWTGAPAAIALAALVGETVGFYAVLAVVILLEQLRVVRTRRRAMVRTLLLLVAEFGAAELLDTLLVRPAALFIGVLIVPDPVWGLLAGKVAADVLFYAIAAGAFTITARTGVRAPRRGDQEQS